MNTTETPRSSRLHALIVETLRSGQAVDVAVSGSSMLPLLRRGDVLTVEPIRAQTLRRGDIALFACHQALLAHRVVQTGPLVTAGDFCVTPDGQIPLADVLGRVVAFRRRGVRVRLDSPLGALLSFACWRYAHVRLRLSQAFPAPGMSRIDST